MFPFSRLVLLGVFGFWVSTWTLCAEGLKGGAARLDISPPNLPVIRNGSFVEGRIEQVDDSLYARALVLSDDTMTLALVVVDSCMIPRTVCDQAKQLIVDTVGLPRDRILISATHTHAAPSVMDFCLGSRADPRYTRFLPGKIAEVVRLAYANREPAKVGFTRVKAGRLTKNRRWITRPDKPGTDPFGEPSVRAMMHPGYRNPDYQGPSGPIDPWFSLISVKGLSGQPLAVLGNFSMHYFSGHAGASADYFGLFCRSMEARLAPHEESFVGILSQGTSGDLWWGDYRRSERRRWSMEEFTEQLLDAVMDAYPSIEYEDSSSLAMAEERLQIARRLPDQGRLAWARKQLDAMAGKRPANRPEVYAEQAFYLKDNPVAEVVLQALRIGNTLITGMPNEVYALTGLKLKAHSPMKQTVNLSLANGATGYIPPREQHALGGYTTWPARTAGLEVGAEARIVGGVLALLETVSGKPRRHHREPEGGYQQRVKHDRPVLHWQMGEMGEGEFADQGPYHGRYQGKVAYYLPGIQSAGETTLFESRAVHFAGGYRDLRTLPVDGAFTLELWFWNGLPTDCRPTTGVLFSLGATRLAITGTASKSPGRLSLHGRMGLTPVASKTWNHVVLVHDEGEARVYLNGVEELAVNLKSEPEGEASRYFVLSGEPNGAFNFEGKIDEVAVYDRVLTAETVQAHFRAAETGSP